MIDRRKFLARFGSVAGGAVLGIGAAKAIQPHPRTIYPIDRYHVGRIIENFDIDHPPVPWCELSNEHRYLACGLMIWWNPWIDDFGLYAPDTKEMFVLKDPR